MENVNMEQVLLFASVIAQIVLALTELLKKTINIKVNFIPLISLVIGVVIGFAAESFTDLDLVLRLWAGAFAGLGGTGLYELFNNREGTSKRVDDTRTF